MPVCPYCGGNVEQQPGEVVLTCPYCGTAFAVGGGEVGEHLMGPVNYTVQQVLDVFRSWALRMPETPNDFSGATRLRDYRLVFYPYWVVQVIGKTKIGGEVEEESVEVSIPAHRSMLRTPLERLRLSLTGKIYYSHRHVVQWNGRLVNPSVGPAEAEGMAKSVGWQSIAERLRRKFGGSFSRGELDVVVADRFLVHVPVYDCVYEYRGRSYRFMADASDARVVYAEVPIELKFRAAALASGVFSLALAAVLLPLLPTAPLFALTCAAGFTFVGIFSLYKGLRQEVKTVRFFES
ncbi:MAG: hypothetical protein QW512_01375 [Thermofilaceae archaeon]